MFSFQPSSFEEEIRDENWVQAMDEVIDSIEKNQTWDLVNLSKDKNLISVMCVYKENLNEKGEIDRFKAILVAKGFSQNPGIDFGEMFSLVGRFDTVREFIAKEAQKKWKLYQIDVKSAFLEGILEEEIYVQQPLGYEIEGKEDKFYMLKKVIYGLKQERRAWYSRIESYMIKNGFCRRKIEATLYTKVNGHGQIPIV